MADLINLAKLLVSIILDLELLIKRHCRQIVNVEAIKELLVIKLILILNFCIKNHLNITGELSRLIPAYDYFKGNCEGA